jgi:hypothetical protein
MVMPVLNNDELLAAAGAATQTALRWGLFFCFESRRKKARNEGEHC